MITLRVLHLSDLHVSAAREWDQRLIIEGLLKDLRLFQAERAIDLVVFTGDLALAGKPDDMARGKAMLVDPLMALTGLGPERVILVPGNHDIDQAHIEAVYEAGLQTKLTGREAVNDFLLKSDLTDALKRLDAWRLFSDTFYHGVSRDLLDPLAWTRRVDLGGTTIGIAALNSVWRSTGAGDAERGLLLLGEPQVHAALESIQGAGIFLVAFHHPLSWMQSFDHNDTRTQLERSGAIVLTGHEHESDPSMDFTTRGSAMYGRVGCLYQTRAYRNSYALIDVDIAASAVRFTLREWVDARHAFDVGIKSAEAGHVTLPLPHRPGASVTTPVPYTRVTQGLLEVLNRSALVPNFLEDPARTSVGDALVPPRLYAVPFPEVVAATLPKKDKNVVARIDPLAAMETNRVVIVNGVAGSGVTSTLIWLIERQFARDGSFLPVYIRFNLRAGKRVIDEDLAEAARQVGLPIGPAEPLTRAVVAIDDVVSNPARAVDRLVTHIQSHKDSLYVLGTHGDEHRAIEAALSKVGLEPYRMFLGPLGRKEVQQIAARVAGEQAGKLPDKVLSVLSDKGLPFTPFVMVTLMAVLIEQPEAVLLDTTAILDAYVNLLLGRAEFTLTGPMDPRGREHFLEYLAGSLTRSGQSSMEQMEAEKIAIGYLESRRVHGRSAGRMIQELIARKILIDEGGYVGFRHVTVQHLFAAKFMAEDAAFNSFVRTKPFEHREIIEHAAALSRANGELLEFVGSVVRPVITEWTEDVGNTRLDAIFENSRTTATDVDTLQRGLQLMAPPADDVLDTVMDDLWERLADVAVEPRVRLNTADRKQVLIASTVLLSGVLVSSELVDNIPLRVDLLKDAIRGWSSVVVALFKEEEEEGTFRKIFEKVVLQTEIKDDVRPTFDRVMRLIILATAAAGAIGTLSRRQNEGLIQEVVADRQFMAGAIHAVITTLLAVFMKSRGWADQLVALHSTHGHHPFVADLVHNLALNRFQHPGTNESDASILKRFLIDDVSERSGDTPHGAQERQRLRSSIDARLQMARRQSKLKGLPVNPLTGEDETDREEILSSDQGTEENSED